MGLLENYGHMVPFYHIVAYAEDAGLTTIEGTYYHPHHPSLAHSLYIAAWALSVIGGASTLGRVLLGWCGDSVGHMRVLRVSVLALAVAMAAWSLNSTMAGIYSFAFAWGFFAGAFISVLPVVLAEFFGADRMASVSGLVYNGFAIGGFLP